MVGQPLNGWHWTRRHQTLDLCRRNVRLAAVSESQQTRDVDPILFNVPTWNQHWVNVPPFLGCLVSDGCLLANARRWANVVLLLARRLRRRPNISTTLDQRQVFAWLWLPRRHTYHPRADSITPQDLKKHKILVNKFTAITRPVWSVSKATGGESTAHQPSNSQAFRSFFLLRLGRVIPRSARKSMCI